MLRFSLFFTIIAVIVLSTSALAFSSARPVHKDFYSILGVNRQSTTDDIKKVYKGLARKLHPDRAPVDKREEVRKQFIEATEAYEILVDDDKRRKFDETGFGMQGNEDRQFLRHNLFAEDFDGKQFKEKEMKVLMDGGNDQPHLVFFWSPNFPDCIDASKPYRQLATKLKGTSIIPGSYKCDDNPIFCRDLALGAVPKLIAFPARGTWRQVKRYATPRYELQSLMAFASEFLSAANRISMPTYAPGLWFDRCPNPETSEMTANWLHEYFYDSSRQSKLAEVAHDFVAFSTGSCMDCDTELNYAKETLGETLPSVRLAVGECQSPEGRKVCKKLGFVTDNKAWTIARVSRRCWYATKKPFAFSNEHCEETKFEKFAGKYDAAQFLNFIFGPMITTGDAIKTMNGDDVKALKESDDAFAIIYANRRKGLPEEVRRQLTLLSLYTSRNPPRVQRQGQTLNVHYAVVECNELPAGACDDVKGKAFPQMAVYPFTKKAKKGSGSPKFMNPEYLREAGFMSMIRDTVKEAAPLRIHVLDNNNFDKKKAAAFERNKRFFILFNAGEWCPPCMQLKPMWPEMARALQDENKDAAKKIAIGVVDCDKERQLCARLGVDGFPSMMYFAKDRAEPTKYGGGRDAEAIKNFAIEQLESRVVALDPQGIMQRINGGGTVLVCFNAGQWCPPCQMIKPTIKKASGLIGNIETTFVDCDQIGQFCQMHGVDGFPTVTLFHRGQKHQWNEGISGSGESLAAWVMSKTSPANTQIGNGGKK